MRVALSALFNIFYIVWTVLVALLLLPFAWHRGILAWMISNIWAGGLMLAARCLCGIRLEVRGREHIAAAPVIYACKHQSALEIIALQWVLRGPVFVLKRELLWLPFFGFYLWRMGMIAIDRSKGISSIKHMVSQARNVLKRHVPIIIFPEGTRTKPGASPQYHPGVTALYSALKVPVVPVAVNTGLIWPKNAFLKKPGVAVMEFLPALPPGTDNKEFLKLLEERIETASNALLK